MANGVNPIGRAIKLRAADVRQPRTWCGLFVWLVFAVQHKARVLVMFVSAVTDLGDLLGR